MHVSESKNQPLRWWIIEDALCNRNGHWFEYLQTFQRGLAAEGDQVRFFASKECVPEVAAAFNAEPVLPKSIWARMSDGAPKWRRFLRIPAHALGTYRAVAKLLASCSAPNAAKSQLSSDRAWPDLIFVPTVLVHHLAGWLPLIRRKLRNVPTRVLLFFPNTPLEFDAHGNVRLAGEPTAKLFRWYIRRFAPEVASGKVVLGAETRPMAKALSEVTGVPFTYLPHPVDWVPHARSISFSEKANRLVFAAYGVARADKGSDLLQKAVLHALERWPGLPVHFEIQWVNDFWGDDGQFVRLDPRLRTHPKVTVIDYQLTGAMYKDRVSGADAMLLPYGSAYKLRVSRVAIEAMVSGIPFITRKETSLASQMREFGGGVAFEGNDPAELASVIKQLADDFESSKEKSSERSKAALEHFSVGGFRAGLSNGAFRPASNSR